MAVWDRCSIKSKLLLGVGSILLVFTVSSIVVLLFVNNLANVANNALTKIVAVRAASRVTDDAHPAHAPSKAPMSRSVPATPPKAKPRSSPAAASKAAGAAAGAGGRTAVAELNADAEWNSF